MPRKDEKISGVYEFSNTTTNMSYIGKSTCIGSTVRSVKSRLNSGKFHNKKMQAEFSIHGLGSYTVEKYIPAGNENINDLLQRIRNEVVEDGYELYNDVRVVSGDVTEIDKYGIDNLSQEKQSIIHRFLGALQSDIDISILDELLSQAGIGSW